MALSIPSGLTQFASVAVGAASTGTWTFDSRLKRQRVVIHVHHEYNTVPFSTYTVTITKSGGGTMSPTEATNSPVSLVGSLVSRVYSLNDADVYSIVGGFGTYTSTITVTASGGGGSARGSLLVKMYYVTGDDQSTFAIYRNSALGGTSFTAGSTPATSGCLIITCDTVNSTSNITEGSAGGSWTQLYEQAEANDHYKSHSQYAFRNSTVTPDCTTAGGSDVWQMSAGLHFPFADLSQITADDTTPAYQQTITLTVSGLPSDTQTNVYFDTQAQTITAWNISGGAGTIGVQYTDRTNQACGTVVDVYVNRNGASYDKASTSYLTPQARSGYTWITLSGTIKTDPLVGLATWFAPDLIVGDQIAYQTTSGSATISVGPDSSASAGAGYAGDPVIAEGYDASTGLWETISFIVNNSGFGSGGTGTVRSPVKSSIRSALRGSIH